MAGLLGVLLVLSSVRPAGADPESLPQARTSDHPVEVMAQRSESRRVLANPDGSTTIEEYLLPRWVRRGADWAPVDTELVRRSDGVVAPKATPVELRLSGGGDAPLATLTRDGSELTLGWPWRLPEPVLDGDTATYPGAIPGLKDVDLRIRAGAEGFAEQIVVKTRQAAADSRLAQIRFRTRVKGGTLRAGRQGDFDVVNAAGTPVFHAPPSLTWDSSGIADRSRAADAPGAGARQAVMRTALSGEDLVVTPDRSMMTSPDTTFPVVIDPDWTSSKMGTTGTAWADVSSSGFHSYNGGNWKQVKVGHYSGWPGSPSSDTYRAFFKFNVSKALNKKIMSAEFHAFLDRSFTCTKSTVELWQTSSFSSSTTWSSKPSLTGGSPVASVSTSGGEPGCSAHDVKLNATKAVTGTTSSVYLALKGGSESSHSYKYFSNVYLAVQFDSLPTLSGLGLSNPKAGCGSAAAPARVGNSTPSLVATVSDADPENPHADFEVWSGTSGGTKVASQSTNGLKSGSQHEMTLPAAALADGQTFRWRVTPIDTAYPGTPSEWCYYSVDKIAPESAPGVKSADLQDSGSGAFNDTIGRTARFAFDPNGAGGVSRYQYAWADDAAAMAPNAPSVPAGPDGTAQVSLTVPYTQDITYRLYVFSFDSAGNHSVNPGVFEFRLSASAGPVGWWKLDETGGTVLADAAGDHPATLTGGTLAAPGRVDSALGLTGGGDHAETAAPVVRADRSFTAAAWVKLGGTGNWATALSQDGPVFSSFFLQYSLENDRWSMSVCGTRALSRDAPTLNRWTHLVGVYDAAAQQAQLYVDGAPQNTSHCTSQWAGADGPLAIGRARFNGGDVDFFPGAVDDVRVYDRVVFATEPNAVDGSTGGAADLANRPPVEEGHWTGDLGSGTTVADSRFLAGWHR
ncbi:LamG domain-containing protein [Nonomuraea sp. NPDC050536]|uniref:LamG domain-containing protein n=1 Tax=Nonomuraea sp. NPDC050536 TaxID=3364366 RepID=UPI0037C7C7C2